mgnify:CR=1 FL=1
MAARTFNGMARIDAAKGFVRIVSGDVYNIPSETSDLVNDVLDGAESHELTVQVFIPEYKGKVTLFGKAKTHTVEQVRNVMKTRSPVILQSSNAQYPSPYIALLPKKDNGKGSKTAGPNLNRKAKDTGPNLNRKR